MQRDGREVREGGRGVGGRCGNASSICHWNIEHRTVSHGERGD